MTNGWADTKTLLQQIEAAEQAGAERDEAIAERDAARAGAAESLARTTALKTVITELEAHLAELAEAIGPTERAAQEQAMTLRAEVAELTRERDSLQQVLWLTRQQESDANERLRQRKAEVMSLGWGGTQQREEEIKAFYETQIALLKTELARARGEQVAAVIVERPMPLSGDGATDAELLEQWKDSPEGQLWTQAGGAHG